MKRHALVWFSLALATFGIAGLYVWVQRPGLLDSGIAEVEGKVYKGEWLSHWYPVATNQKEDPGVVEALQSVLSSRSWNPLDSREVQGRASLTLVLRNGRRLAVGCSNDDVAYIQGRSYRVNKRKLQSALDALLEAALEKLPEGDVIIPAGNIVSLNGAVEWPSGSKDVTLVDFTAENNHTQIAEFEQALSQRKPCRYRPGAIVADLYLRLRDGTWLFLETYKDGQIILEEHEFKSAHCSEVDPAKLAVVYSLWLPKAK